MLNQFSRRFNSWGIALALSLVRHTHPSAPIALPLRHLWIAGVLWTGLFAPQCAMADGDPAGSIYYIGMAEVPFPMGPSPEDLAAQLVPIAQKAAEGSVIVLNGNGGPCANSHNCAKLTGSATCSVVLRLVGFGSIHCTVPGEYYVPSYYDFGGNYNWGVILPPLKSCPAGNDNTNTNYGNPCNALTGEKTQTETDLSNPVEGLSVVRTYSSYSSLASGVGLYEQDQGYGLGWSAPFYKNLNIALATDGTTLTSILAYRGHAVYVPFVPNGTGFVPQYATTRLQLSWAGTEYVVRQDNGATERYNATGRLLSETNAHGQTTSYGYNASGKVATVTGPYGHTLTFTYTADGHIDTLTDPTGQVIRYTYNNKNLVQVNYPDGTGKIYHYELGNYGLYHHLTGISMINADGTTSRFATFSYTGRQAAATEHAITTNPTAQEKFQFTYAGTYTDVTDPAGNKERLYIATQNNTKLLTQRTNLVDNKNLFQTFDANNNLTCKQDEEGRVTTSIYNSTSQRVSQTTGRTGTCSAPVTTPATRTTTYAYLTPTLDLPTVIESPSVSGGTNKKRTTIAYTDTRFPTLPTSITQSGYTPGGVTISRTVTLSYNATGQVATINGPRAPTDPGMAGVDDVTTLTYYDCVSGGACGQLKTVTNALGQVTTYNSYYADGRVQQTTDPNGLLTYYDYDPRGRVANITQTSYQNGYAVLNSRTITYTPDGQIATTYSYPGNLQVTYTYDAAHNLRRIADNLGNQVNYTYDVKGNRTSTVTKNPDGTQAQSLIEAYDLRNHVSALNHGGNLTTLIHDAVGNVTKEIDPNHTDIASTDGSVNGYDALNRLAQTTDLLNGLTQYTYDINDRVSQVTTPNQASTTSSYDDLGNLLQEVSPDRGTTTYAYDAAGNVVSQTDARNILVTYTYDALNRLSFVDYPSTTLDITYTYDSAPGCTFGLGRLCRMSKSSLAVTYAYNGFGYLTDQTQTLAGIAFTTHTNRNPWGWVTGLTYPDGRQVKYTRDARGRITAVNATVNGVVTPMVSNRILRADDLLTRQTFGNGITDRRYYTYAGWLYYQFLGTADTRVYGYDFNGNLISKQTLPEVAGYTYDPLNRLTEDTDPTPLIFTYDANGNRKTGATAYTYLPNTNRLATVNGQTINLSPNGNVRNDPARGLQYNYSITNELLSVYQNGVTIVGYGYDPQHRRVSKLSAEGYTLYHYDDAGHLLQETDNTGALIRAYVWADDAPIAQITQTSTGEVLTYLHTDYLHTPRLATDTTGKVVWRWEGNAFGDNPPNEDPTSTGVPTTINLRYAGQYYDKETGLHYNWYRYYDPRLGRYITSDPIGLRGGLNTYSYVHNNPLRWIDPTGRDGQEVLGDILHAGLVESLIGDILGDQAISDARKSGLPGAHNGPQDAYRHCLWSCLMAKSIGFENAKVIGDNHEDAGNRGGQPGDEEKMDRNNNQQGRMCGVSNNPDCPKQCLDKLLNGELSGLGGNPISPVPR